MIKNKVFNYKAKIEIKATTTTVIKNKLKYCPMSEGRKIIISKGLIHVFLFFCVSFVKRFKM